MQPRNRSRIPHDPHLIPAPRGQMAQWFVGQVAEALSPSDPEKRALRDAASSDIVTFTEATYPAYIAEPFHRHVGAALDQVERGEIKRLMLFAPPQHGKSHLVSFELPAYYLGHHPDEPILLTSYAAELAVQRNSVNSRSIVESDVYGEIFPHVRPNWQRWRQEEWHPWGHRGYVRAAGVGGPITGHGFRLVIVDDPYQNWAAAQSETIRRSVYEWWKGTLYQRIWEGGAIVLMLTRWHEDDIAGRLLAEEGRVEDGGKWHVRSYMALVEDEEDAKADPLGRKVGQALCPRRYSAAYLKDTREVVGPMVWSSEYQQRPTRPAGDFFKPGRIEIVENIPAEIGKVMEVEKGRHFVAVDLLKGIRFWDLAATEKSRTSPDPDFTTGPLIATHEGIWYILDLKRDRLKPEDVKDTITTTAKADGRAVRIFMEQEGGASGKHVVSFYVIELAGWSIDPWPASGDAMVKAHPWASQVNAGNVKMLKAPWNQVLVAEHAGFPFAKHDDTVIGCSGGFNAATSGVKVYRKIQFLKV